MVRAKEMCGEKYKAAKPVFTMYIVAFSRFRMVQYVIFCLRQSWCGKILIYRNHMESVLVFSEKIREKKMIPTIGICVLFFLNVSKIKIFFVKFDFSKKK